MLRMPGCSDENELDAEAAEKEKDETKKRREEAESCRMAATAGCTPGEMRQELSSTVQYGRPFKFGILGRRVVSVG